jgi:hypothetical protein
MSEDQPDYTPDQLAQAAELLRAQGAPTVTPPPEDDMARDLAARQAAGPAGITDVDVAALIAGIQALQSRVDALEAEKAAGAALPVAETAKALRDLIATHAAHTRGTDHAGLLRLADDAVDAAGNAADSGDGTLVRQIAGKIARALAKVNPGPGDHHYYRQAVDFAAVHLPDAADELVPQPKKAPVQVTSPRGSVPVVQGSVTG